MKEITLVISPQKQWKLWKAALFAVRREGEQYVVKGSVDGIDNDNDLWSLWRRCKNTTPEKIYEEFGKKFKTQEKFWDGAEDKVKRHVKYVMDMRLNDCVSMAMEKDIPIYIRHSYNEDLHMEKNLVVSDACVVPRMHFVRGENDIRYVLSLLIEGILYNPKDIKVEVVSNSPALFAADMNGRRLLLRMDESFSAALLEPFASKSEIIIPRRIENDYMHRFILKNVAKTEIEAEGFDIEEADVNREVLLCLEHSLDSHAVVVLRFMYGRRMYDASSKGKVEVRLEEKDDGFRFVRVSRDKEWEEWCKKKLCERVEGWGDKSDDTLPAHKRFKCMSDAVDWLSCQCNNICAIEGFSIRQFSTSPYYIGSFKIETHRMWQNDWLHLHISILMDDGEKVPFMFFRDAIIRGEKEITLPSGKVFLLPDEWFAKYAGMMMVARCDGQQFVIHSSQLAALGSLRKEWAQEEKLSDTEIHTDQETPDGLRASLRPYQKEGFDWLYRNFMYSTGCCLADEMGLGKTIQTIALLLKYKEASTPNDTERKIEKKKTNKKWQAMMMDMFADFFADEETKENANNGVHYLTSIVICPSSLVHNWRNELQRFAPNLSVCEYVGNKIQRSNKLQNLMRWDVVITTYRTAVNDIEMLSGLKFGICVFDESQMFKNRSSQVYAAMKRIQSVHRMALSGTPMENNLNELWSLMNILNDRLLGDFRTFYSNFTTPISENMESERTRILERIVAPYFLCRRKKQVLCDLPPRQDIMVTVDMNEEQESIYTEELSAARNVVLSCMGFDNEMKTHTEGGNLNVLAAIGRLRQLANDPRLLSHSVQSAKTDTVIMRLEELYGTDHKVLLFSDYVSYLDIIADEMKARGWKYDMLTGETKNREQVIRHFNEDSHTQFFLISLKAGGVGLNLTSADYVFMLTPWWNKAAEEQAISRAYRIGQERGVFVYNFVTKNTLEEQILTLQDRKMNLVDAVLPFLK